MARLTQQLNQIWQESQPELGIPEIKKNYDHLIQEKGRRTCLISGENEPVKGGIYADVGGGYPISSQAVLNRSGTEGLIGLGIAFGDAILDGEPSKESMDLTIKHILTEIEYGMRYAIVSGSVSE